MPFTGSHPAAVLPFLRTGLVPSALVIGSMTPDLVYYVPLPQEARWPVSHASHTVTGIVGLDLLMGLFAFVVWQALIAPLAVAVSPRPVRDRVGGLPVPLRQNLGTLRAAALVVLSLLVGAVTHVFWDEFTHPDRWGTAHMSWLAQQHGSMLGARWAQFASSVVGLLLIGWALWRWWSQTPPRSVPSRIRPVSRAVSAWVVAIVLLCTGAGSSIGLWAALTRPGTQSLPYLVATYGGGAGLFAVLACALVMIAPRSRAS
ncbi:DUF4184 family protein [Kineosporia sp. NBRC 101731]|uniref:DUF4184 family protein n=1 Tax=Kineosporia sp. NBRC 101731 TaxID=3032199 RepID=UPI0024A5C842|nr:DUF4184 family protein [Kineosporia sp. NBRC 101731]GLY28489.1 hypothetical protein Kisp02_18540 [Kineosporia sp. NBRC 101731]